MLANGFNLNPDPYLLPGYKISPFRTEDIAFNRSLPFSDAADGCFRGRFVGRRFVYCHSGREAIRLALRALAPRPEDAVTILTTSGNVYISSCVTREIEQHCRWSRKREAATRILLVNHEFGFGHEGLRTLKAEGMPLIEDAAHSFLSNNAEGSLGAVGDFLVLSFPKFFPIQIGGLLAFNSRFEIPEPVDNETRQYVQRVLSFHLARLEGIRERRRANHAYLVDRLGALGCRPRFELAEFSVPGVFLFQAPDDWDLPALKEFMWTQGIECSVFYGEQAFYIPVNERLQTLDLDYFIEAVNWFIRRSPSEKARSGAKSENRGCPGGEQVFSPAVGAAC